MTNYIPTLADVELSNAIETSASDRLHRILREKLNEININRCDITENSLVTPLWTACRKSTTDVVSALLEYGADPNVIVDSYGFSVLHHICQCHDYDKIKLFIQYKAQLNIQDKFGRTPLLLLCYNMNRYTLSCMRLLLENGANPNIQNTEGYAPLSEIIFRNYRNEFEMDAIRLLLRYGASVDLQISPHPLWDRAVGDTALHAAIRRNNIGAAKAILECITPDIWINNIEKETPYSLAVMLRCQPVIDCMEMSMRHQLYNFLERKWASQISTK